jgi:hypothetical protein
MIGDHDSVRGARARLVDRAGDYVDAVDKHQRLALNGSDPTELEAAGRKVSAARVRLVAAVQSHGEAWAREHRERYASLVRELETAPAALIAGYARRVGGRG